MNWRPHRRTTASRTQRTANDFGILATSELNVKRLLLSSLMAVGMTASLALFIQRPGRHWFDVLLWPAWVVGSWVSGNAHQPNEFAFWVAVFVMDLVLAYVLVSIVGLVGRSIREVS